MVLTFLPAFVIFAITVHLSTANTQIYNRRGGDVYYSSRCGRNTPCAERVNPGDLCHPNPCGTNAQCQPGHDSTGRQRPVCTCLPGYVGDAISHCSRGECLSDAECGHSKSCRNYECKNPCAGVCGVNAECEVRNHVAVCKCPIGYSGDPFRQCVPAPHTSQQGNRNSGCGPGVKCPGSSDPCSGACGVNAECRLDSSSTRAVCSCPKGYIGHALESCRRETPEDLCHPNPCGTNAQCQPGHDNTGRSRPVCTCLPGYIGNALSHCNRGECQSDAECGHSKSCRNYECRNPCEGACGVNADCDVRNHIAVCKCGKGYTGDPFTQCVATASHISSDSRQPGNIGCAPGVHCGNVDPCAGACGVNAECRTDPGSLRAICSCPKGYIGHALESCRRETPEDLCHPSPCGTNAQCQPGHDNTGRARPVCTCLPGYVGDALSHCTRGECERDSDCGHSKTCLNYECRNPCAGVCGVNAECEVRDRRPICKCPKGYTGHPFTQCIAEAIRETGGTQTCNVC